MMETVRSYWIWVEGLQTRELMLVALGVAVVIGLLAGVVVRGIQALLR
jgi:ABC-type proline/glycine betaine transport system permease subunit